MNGWLSGVEAGPWGAVDVLLGFTGGFVEFGPVGFQEGEVGHFYSVIRIGSLHQWINKRKSFAGFVCQTLLFENSFSTFSPTTEFFSPKNPKFMSECHKKAKIFHKTGQIIDFWLIFDLKFHFSP